eukprot:GFKZ01006131.1.p1 GENE.GFKZ01006131.1~~GFKZ01006131.1.p1  ORF type:complete len:107 (+),score=2.32 GFKZ01006131.1:177-497(+)
MRHPMNHLGDHSADHSADHCAKGHGWKNRNSAIRDLLGRQMFQAAGARVVFEAKHCLRGLQARPAYILVHPLPSLSNPAPQPPVSFNFTVSSPYQPSFLHSAARRL